MESDKKSREAESNIEFTTSGNQFEKELDVAKIVTILSREKWVILLFVFTFSLGAVAYSLLQPNMYKSTAVLLPAQSANGGGLAKLASQFGGLAALAGVDFAETGSNKPLEALEIIESWAFIESFIEDNNIEAEVFAATSWNNETRELIFDKDIYDPEMDVWTRDPPNGKEPKPSSWEMYEVFLGEYLNVTKDKASGFTKLSIEYYSPDIAKDWTEKLVARINAMIQEKDSLEAQRNIQFLKEQIGQTSVSNMQSVFYDLIEEQTKTLMLAKASSDYVFKVVSDPRIPEEKSKPNRALICILTAIFGGILGCLVAILKPRKD